MDAKSISPHMDPGIWSRMPYEILEHVLSFLPLKTFLKLRSTCKYFKSLISSKPFITKYHSDYDSSSTSSFLMLSHPQFRHQCPLYDTNLNAWRKLSISFSPMLSSTSPNSLISVSNGLLCFSLPNSHSFVISNVLTRSNRIIKFPLHPFSFELATLVSTATGFKLFIMSSTSGLLNHVFVYDSGNQIWNRFDGCKLNQQQGVMYNGCLYFTTPEPFSIVRFDFERGDWGRLMVELPIGLTFVRLVNGDGNLYLIGGIGSNGISRSMKLWELSGGNWVEVGSVPDMVCRKFVSVCYHNYDHIDCFWHQGMICVSCYTWPEILYYRVLRRNWHWLPKCPSLPEKWSCGFRWFSIVPELYAFI